MEALNILQVSASGRTEASISRKLSAELIEALTDRHRLGRHKAFLRDMLDLGILQQSLKALRGHRHGDHGKHTVAFDRERFSPEPCDHAILYGGNGAARFGGRRNGPKSDQNADRARLRRLRAKQRGNAGTGASGRQRRDGKR